MNTSIPFIILHSPWFGLLIPLLIAAVVFKVKYSNKLKTPILFSEVRMIKKIGSKNIIFSRVKDKIPFVLRLIAMFLIIAALIRPQEKTPSPIQPQTSSGTDIIITLDTSPSMLALDFNPDDRLTVAKYVISNFIKGRVNDRIGLVVFSGAALSMSPLTTDYDALLRIIPAIDHRITQTQGTAIGDAIVTALNRVKNSKAKSKVIILVTDGRSNVGQMDPISASQLAGRLGIKIYTIGVGKEGRSVIPIQDAMGNTIYTRTQEDDLDEPTLREIAQITGGFYERAESTEALQNIFNKINALEKTEFKKRVSFSYKELFNLFIIPAFAILALEYLVSHTLCRKLP